ncbi:hypothetical protein RRG08_042063 [Elysia crispata]|uniref:Uncharacterized protein n=1 Tax=Elysia crispata TaxID=231223 RepID=A0AAE1CIT3_9GAST|nr:hypothetical protein RRG08_042063 [Elysia crispata]
MSTTSINWRTSDLLVTFPQPLEVGGPQTFLSHVHNLYKSTLTYRGGEHQTKRGRGLETKRSRVIRPIEVVDMTQESQRSFERFFDF